MNELKTTKDKIEEGKTADPNGIPPEVLKSCVFDKIF